MLVTIWVSYCISDQGSIPLKFFNVADKIRREMLLLRRNIHCKSTRVTFEHANQCDCLNKKSKSDTFTERRECVALVTRYAVITPIFLPDLIIESVFRLKKIENG